eukprot:scaffold2744_cov136-Cylindrotheca_fusiformis.AAC.14
MKHFKQDPFPRRDLLLTTRILGLLASFLLLHDGSSAFSPPIGYGNSSPFLVSRIRKQHRLVGFCNPAIASEAQVSPISPRTTTALSVENKEGDDTDEKEDYNSINDYEDDDIDFYHDLQRAKKAKLGADLPRDQLKESAVSAEEEFLQAMQQSREEFEQAKQIDEGVSASEFFLRKIKEAEEELENDDHDDDLPAFQ